MLPPVMGKKRKAETLEEEVEEESSSGEYEEVEVDEEEEEAEEEIEEKEQIEEEAKEEEEAEEEETEEEIEEEEEEEEIEEKLEDENGELNEESKRETLKKLLEPFGKDQLIKILKEAAFKNQSIIEQINQLADSDPTYRKIFIHRLSYDITNETLISFFNQYGQIEECNVIIDKNTGKSKGYGFVLFKTREGAEKALKQPNKKIGNQISSCKLASQRTESNQLVSDSLRRKIFVNNVGQHIHPERIRAFFSIFGEIEEFIAGTVKGFALIVYKTSEGCKKALEEPIKLFEGCKLHCQRAIEGTNEESKNLFGDNLVGFRGVLSPNDLAFSYGMGSSLNSGISSRNLNPSSLLMGQNQGLGHLYPIALDGTSNHGTRASMSSWVDRNTSTISSSGLGVGLGGQISINSISPSVIGSYDSQAALQGLGAYQRDQLGQSSRTQSGVGSLGTIPSYFGR